jgi:cell division protein FtsI (penicillin-binding protein 3)
VSPKPPRSGSGSGRRSSRPPRWDRDPFFDRDAPIDTESWFQDDPRLHHEPPPATPPRAAGPFTAPGASRSAGRPGARQPAQRSRAAAHRAVPAGANVRYRPRHEAPRPRRFGLTSRGRTRAFGLLAAIVVAFGAIAVKLSFIQGVDAQQYLAVGKSEWTTSVVLPGERGAILDRNGDELALSVPMTTIYGDPHEVGRANVVSDAKALSPVLGISEATLEHELSENNGFVYLARTIPANEAAKVAKLNLPGIASLQEPKRIYPAGQLASPLLGSVGTDDTGLGGLEYQYNSLLTGQSGKLVEETDPEGRAISGGVQEYKAPVAGNDLVLSIDEPLQYDAEQALAQAIVAARAKSGIVLLMDSKTGEILADANLTMPGSGTTQTPAVPVNIPSPSAVTAAADAASTKKVPQVQPVEASSATAFTQTYEPGSVNKLITISAALQEGVIKPSDTFPIPSGYPVAGTVFHDAEDDGGSDFNVTSILANSSNIGTIQVAQRLGQANLLKYIHAYGEGSKTDIDFPGESAGLLPTYWSGTTLPTVAFGQGIGVTAIQMLAAYNTIANGGVYVAPKLVDGTIDAQGQEHPTAPSAEHRIVSTKVAAEMTTMLDQVVQVGTGTAASMLPYTVAGKTGTALVPNPTKGGYIAGHYVASFAGFVPAEKPSITALVMINNTIDYGASASAPTFKTVAQDAVQELKIPPQKMQPPAPGVPIISAADATAAGDSAGTPLAGLTTPVSVVPPPTTPTSTTPTTTKQGTDTAKSTSQVQGQGPATPTATTPTAVSARPPADTDRT